MTDEEFAQRLFLLHVAVLRRERSDWLNGEDHIEMMRGESYVEPEEKQPIDVSVWLISGLWILVTALLVIAMKKLVAS